MTDETASVQGEGAVPQIRVTIEDLATGESETQEVMDDYLIIAAGSCFIDGVQAYGNGTHVLTVKGRRHGP